MKRIERKTYTDRPIKTYGVIQMFLKSLMHNIFSYEQFVRNGI